MSQRQIAFARALPILILTVVCGAVIVFLVLRTAGGINRSEAFVDRFAPLVAVCNGQGAADAAAYEPEQEPDVAVGFRHSGGEWLLDPSAVPGTMQPEAASAVELVLCLDPAQPLSTVACEAEEGGVRPTRVYGEVVAVRLLVARSGELLAEDMLESAPEPDCVQTDGDEVPVRVSSEQIHDWLQRHAGDN